MGRTTHNVGSAAFIADPHSVDRLNGRQIDWTHVDESHRTTPGLAPVTVAMAGAAAQGATSLTVAALSGPVPSGTALDFGTDEFAITTADAAAGATTIAVRALANALEGAETATYAGRAGSGSKVLRAGTVVGDTLGSGKVSPRVASTNPAKGMLETDAREDSDTDAITGYGVIVGGVVYENLLPDAVAGSIAAGIKTELAANTKGFLFQTYEDDRGE